jgi:hypothetical protein
MTWPEQATINFMSRMKKYTLIDKYLPQYTFNEYHESVVNAPIDRVYGIARNLDLSKSKTIKFLFKIRGLPTKRLNLQHFLKDIGFTNLEEDYPNETLTGFWVRFKIAEIPSYEDFIHNSISPWIKVVWNFQFKDVGEDKTKVSTETRVLCVAPITKITFGIYWGIIKPFSGLIRLQMLKIIKNDSEQ